MSKLVLISMVTAGISAGVTPALAQIGTIAEINAPLTPITAAQRDRMSRSLVGVQTVTLLRDRGALDERQRARVATLEAELAAALAARDAAVSGTQIVAQARLEQARTAFDAEVVALVAANQNLRLEIDALRATLLVSLPTLTDEEVRLRQRFADGDRVGTRAIMEKLDADWDAAAQLLLERAQAELARTTNLQRAARKRDAAQRAGMSVSKGDAEITSAQVLDLWDQAAALDPTHFWTHIERARWAETIGDYERARTAAWKANSTAVDDRQRVVAQMQVGDVSVLQGDLGHASSAFAKALVWSRSLLSEDPSSALARSDVAGSLIRTGSLAQALGNLTYASSAYAEALEINRGLLSQYPNSSIIQRYLMGCLDKVGSLLISQGDLVAARTAYSEHLAIARSELSSDASSVEAQRGLAESLAKIGRVALMEGNLASARSAYNESLVIVRSLLSLDPSSAQARRALGMLMGSLAQAQSSEIRWPEVAAYFQAMKRDNLLAPSDYQMLVQIEQLAAQEVATITSTSPPRN